MLSGIIGRAESINKVIVRLTLERWFHISENHSELTGESFRVLEAINNPDMVVEGLTKELLALQKIDKKYLVSVYREINRKDGFVITAFYTSDLKSLLKRRKIIWQKSAKKK